MKTKTSPAPQRQLMIKAKTCQRLLKEVSYYEKEVTENQEKLNEMKDQDRNPFDIKKFAEILDESHRMVPDSKNRLEEALRDLATYMASEEVKDLGSEIVENEWHEKALEILKENNVDQQNCGDSYGNLFEETDTSNLREGEDF
eukprot:CAMPEP_0197175020 /NCGR_PEP_ID=MMETSP1423-20130617/1351_1 /TAXON_ID=476441 /ORGANISM="Pseudo-nitzschia heimii, Strain UNC1101" /LENGTH=143 /DNA_ID=CAMNT_0042624059 /DNA_START=9 /DNA_END=440 /DNA_ORIENTATION=-